MSAPTAIGIVGDFLPSSPTHHGTNEALIHAADQLGVDLDYSWVGTSQLERRGTGILERFDGIWAAPGSPQSVDGALAGIRFARERMWPFVAT